MKKKKRLLLGLVGPSAMALVASACGAQDSSQDPTESTDTVESRELVKTTWSCTVKCLLGDEITYTSCSTTSTGGEGDASKACSAAGKLYDKANKASCKTTGKTC